MQFESVAELAVTPTARVELCRALEGDAKGEFIAVKRLHADVATDPEFLAMFRDEMWMAASLTHPNVARVISWGDDDDGPFLALEFIKGVSLSRLLRTVCSTGEEFPERLVAYVAWQVALGLVAAHELRAPNGRRVGLVHRDLTPGNVLLGFEGEVKIIDFGIAKAEQRITRTISGVLKGDPAYMCPEHIRGDSIDGRADLFALGVVMFELLSQRAPWTIGEEDDAITVKLTRPHEDLGKLCPRLGRALVDIVHRCIAPLAEDRYKDASTLADALEEWLELRGLTDSTRALSRFVRRNALRQKRLLERMIDEADEDDEDELPTLFRRHSAQEAKQTDDAATVDEDGPSTMRKVTGHEDTSLDREPATRPVGFNGANPVPGRVVEPDPDAPPIPIALSSTQAAVTQPKRDDSPQGVRRAAQQIAFDAARLAVESKMASEHAHAIATRAEEAVRTALELVQRSERAAKAAKLAGSAILAVTEDDTARARALIERAKRLIDDE